jgi:hypothetical protein
MNSQRITNRRILGTYLLVQVIFYGIAGLTDDASFAVQYLIGLIALNIFVYLTWGRIGRNVDEPMGEDVPDSRNNQPRDYFSFGGLPQLAIIRNCKNDPAIVCKGQCDRHGQTGGADSPLHKRPEVPMNSRKESWRDSEMKDHSKWIEAAAALVKNPFSQVLCPNCGMAFLTVEDEHIDGGHIDRHLKCSKCGAHEVVQKRATGESA